MTAYYNEIDPYAAQWLRNLISTGLVPAGDVDERSIADVQPGDLAGYVQCHFFAGIAGWSRSLRLAGWPDTRPVWTGSCPCQPFSEAGDRKAFEDDRHLWPKWFRLIRERKPPIIFGEQVAEAIRWGWLDAVANDLETEDYAFGATVLPACSVGSKQIRNRVWFLAHTAGQRRVNDGRQQRPKIGDQARALHIWPSEPGVPCMADDVPGRMAFVRAFGNAIVPGVAAEFIAAARDVIDQLR